MLRQCAYMLGEGSPGMPVEKLHTIEKDLKVLSFDTEAQQHCGVVL
jgi:hypothetical protein